MYYNIYMGLKDFLIKKQLEKQLKNLPENQKKVIMKMVDENPDFFKKINNEINENVKNGQDKMLASVSVMKKYQSQIQKNDATIIWI